MPTPKLEVRHFKNKNGEAYIFHRYWDDHCNNFEYQVYQLVEARDACRSLGVSEFKEGRNTELNSREMCDELFSRETNFHDIIRK